jgi:hypothetical protein
MVAILYPYVHRSLADRIRRCVHDFCRREPARVYLGGIPLHNFHPSPISHPYATRHLPTIGAHPESGQA